jgi:hypothetical protein
MMKLGIGEGGSAQGMSDPPSQLIGQEHQDVMGLTYPQFMYHLE